MNIDKEGIKEFRKEFTDAVKGLQDKFGVNITLGSITFDPGIEFSGRLSVKVDNARELEFKKIGHLYGFKETDYGRTFKLNGNTYKLIGINPKAPKNCCIILDINANKEYATSETVVTRHFV